MAWPRIAGAPHWSETPIARVLHPMQEFVHRSASSGLVLMSMTVIALALANSPLAQGYQAALETEIGISAGSLELRETTLHWINDGLMAIFFFLIGLEIKREVQVGELSNVRAALLPAIAATGGAIVPAIIFWTLNPSGPAASGWGIPMATDIAFALGVLALLGSRVPFSLKVFLTAVAIVDDLLAVLVIAIFYSGGLNWTALAAGFGVLALLMLANTLGIRNTLFYISLGVVVWLAFLKSGVHATIAGVLIAWTIPARNRIDGARFLERSRDILSEFENSRAEPSAMLTDETQQAAVIALEEACEDVQAPLQKLEHSLHVGVSFVIMPIFALANAGVALSLQGFEGEAAMVSLGIAGGLLLGKPVGLLGATWLAVRLGMARLPEGVGWAQMVGVACLAGIGFTMSLFIAALGLPDPALLAVAKISILLASLVAGVLGFTLLRWSSPPTN